MNINDVTKLAKESYISALTGLADSNNKKICYTPDELILSAISTAITAVESAIKASHADSNESVNQTLLSESTSLTAAVSGGDANSAGALAAKTTSLAVQIAIAKISQAAIDTIIKSMKNTPSFFYAEWQGMIDKTVFKIELENNKDIIETYNTDKAAFNEYLITGVPNAIIVSEIEYLKWKQYVKYINRVSEKELEPPKNNTYIQNLHKALQII